MEIREPVFVRRLRAEEFEATGTLEGYGAIRRRGHSEEEAKNRFFETCNRIGMRVMGGCPAGRRRSGTS